MNDLTADDTPTTSIACRQSAGRHPFPNDPARIRCIAFDAVGTLMEPYPSAAQAYHLVARRHGSRLEGPEIARRFRAAFRDTEAGDLAAPHDQRLATSESLERERWRTIVTRVIDDVPDGDACFDELFRHFACPGSWRCFADVPAALERIARSGRIVALASNFDGRLHAVCDGLDSLRDVTRRVISAEVGHRKPSRRFYDALLAVADCRADELLMVGDDPDNDLKGAQDCGISAVLIDRKGPPGPDRIAGLAELTRWLEAVSSPSAPADKSRRAGMAP